MKKSFIIVLLMFSVINLFGNNKVSLQLSWLHQFQFAGYYVAKEKGFYKELGLDVQIKEVRHNTNVVNEVENEEVDFAIGRSSLLIDKMNGKDIVALGAIYQHSPLMLLVLKDSNINSVEDLKNKKIMLTQNAQKTAAIQAMLNANHLNENDINIIPHTFNLNDLITGKTHAMASYLSNEPIRLSDKDIEFNILHPREYGFDFYNDILFTSSNLIEKNPKLVKDFFDATIKGWHYAFENVIETSELIYKKYNTQNKSLIHLIKEGEILKNLAYANDGDIGCLEKSRLHDILNVFKVLGLVNGDEKLLDDFIYEFNTHQKMSFEYTPEQKNIFLVSLGFLLIILLVIFYFLRKLHFEKKLLNSVINSTDDLIYFKDKRFRYLGCNKAFEEFVGKSKSEIVGKTIFELFDKRTSDLFSSVDRNVIKKEESEVTTEWVTSSTNEEVYLQNKKTPFKYNIKDVGVLGVCRDLTKIKELEDEHLKQQKNLLTQSKIVAMGEMLCNIAHQWRQPLSVITTSVSSLKLISEIPNETLDKSQINYYSDMVLEQSSYLSKTIDDFQSFFTQDSNDIKSFNIKESLLKTKDLINESFESENIKIVMNLIDINITSNENSLIQSFINICNNSKDAMLIKDIERDKRYLFISLEKQDSNIRIIFKDSAGGIDTGIMDKLFEPYFTTKHQAQGTGIGLYMTHQIISKQLNGTIEIQNVSFEYKNKSLDGTKVTILIPTS